ncbi:MAG: sugar phosphate isomerase/epimerase family protein [Bryobacter sp.]|nr:sugar phosphate isomerase/epimerase family protein [Bryobacter sp.]
MTHRRQFLTAASLSPLGFAAPAEASNVTRRPGTWIRVSLNAYTFNKLLTSGKMTVKDMIDFCSEHHIEALDLTGYYLPGYPAVASDEYLYDLKRHAFLNGVTISGTGVRNDFALTDAASRAGHIQLVKNWVDVAVKLGADMVRVFAGKEVPAGQTFDKVLAYMVPAFQECSAYAAQRGVLLGLQHHADFLQTADETIRLIEAVNSPWFTVMVDIGSLRVKDVYEEIDRLMPYATHWQIKEHVWYGKKIVPTDFAKLRQIIEKHGYRGFFPIEPLTAGESKEAVVAFLNKVRAAFA